TATTTRNLSAAETTIRAAYVAGQTPAGKSLAGAYIDGLGGLSWGGGSRGVAPVAYPSITLHVEGETCWVTSRNTYTQHTETEVSAERALEIFAEIRAVVTGDRAMCPDTGRPLR